VRSSPASGASGLELPAVTLADRLADVLAVLAACLLAWACTRAGHATAGVVVAVLSATVAVARLGRGRRKPPRTIRIDLGRQGQLCVARAGQPPRRMYVGRDTRILGPSVYLDLRAETPGPDARVRRWLTPLDVPGAALRQWSVVLPRCGRPARS
jgi:hypothetical protein